MKHFLLSLSILFGSLAGAQQEPIFSQFWNAKTYYNPAMTGVGFKHLSTTIGRWQDVGVNGAPVTQLLGYAINLKKLHGGLGFTYMRENYGYNTFNKTKFNYSYQIKTDKEGIFSFGIGAGFNNLDFDPSGSTEPSPDPFKRTGFTADFGFVYSSKKMNFALSGTQLTSTRLGTYRETPHLILMSDYIFGNEEGFQLKPQVFVMSDLEKVLADANLMLYWKGKLGAGVTYRTEEGLSFSVNWDIVKKFRIGYAYDLPSGTSGDSKGSHTGFLGLVFK